MKYVFTSLLLIHGLMHLVGFTKAFFSTEITKQALGLSKPIGAIWLVVFILFIVSASSFVNNKKWFYIAFIGVIISQVLIIMAWSDTKFGTIPNLIIFFVVLLPKLRPHYKK